MSSAVSRWVYGREREETHPYDRPIIHLHQDAELAPQESFALVTLFPAYDLLSRELGMYTLGTHHLPR